MRSVLSAVGLAELRRFARRGVLLGLDFDGTLAPIVPDPRRAEMRASTYRLLGRVATIYPCVVISGRGRADTVRRLRGIPALEVLGNHGVDPAHGRPRAVLGWQRKLERALSGSAGIWIENKGASLSVHYREAPRPDRARAAILAVADALPHARILTGKKVVNVLPRGAGGKGVALLTQRRKHGCDAAIYVGDDDTDEEVFALGGPDLLGVRVGPSRDSAARFAIPSQAEIDPFLRHLLAARRPARSDQSIRRSAFTGGGAGGTRPASTV